MTVPTEAQQVPGRRLGLLAPANDPRNLLLAAYVSPPALPAPPAHLYLSKPVATWPMYLNDQLGDCAIADPAHAILMRSALAGAPYMPTDAQVLAAYQAVSGYQPGHPDTDVGCNMNAVMNYWRHTGIASHAIAGYAAVNPADNTMVKQALWLFGAVHLGLALPLSAQAQVGQVWKVGGTGRAPGSWGGHAVPVVDYDSQHLVVVTWGQRQLMTWGFLHRYCQEAYVTLEPDWIAGATAKAPTGFDYRTLAADLASFSR